MAKFVADIIRDKGLEYFAERAAGGHVKLVICAGAPASYAEANATADGAAGKRKTGETAALPAEAFPLGAGDPDGRAVTVAEQLAVPVSYTGPDQTSDHAVLLDTGAAQILAYTGFAGQVTPSGNKLDIAAWAVRIEAQVV